VFIPLLRRALRRAFYHLRGYTRVTEYGIHGDGVIWEFQGSKDDWIRWQLVLMATENDDTDYSENG
jgi:hypothetical protein